MIVILTDVELLGSKTKFKAVKKNDKVNKIKK